MSEFLLRVDDGLLSALRKGTAFASDEEMLTYLITSTIYGSNKITPASQLILVGHKIELRRHTQ